MTNDKRVIENLRENYQEIMSNYVIIAYATSRHGFVSGAVCAPPLLSLNAIKNIAGYSLSDDIIADKIVSYCISKRYYDVYDIENLILEKTGGVYLYS